VARGGEVRRMCFWQEAQDKMFMIVGAKCKGGLREQDNMVREHERDGTGP
jgi:hypothetical protein